MDYTTLPASIIIAAGQSLATLTPINDALVDHFPTSSIPEPNGVTSPKSLLMGAPLQTVAEKAATGKPIIYIRENCPPFWITHGTADTSVAFEVRKATDPLPIGTDPRRLLRQIINAL